MKIADLFIAIGFKVGPNPLPEIENRLNAGAKNAAQYAVALDAAAAALTLITSKAINAALNLNKFRYATGENTDTLQRWEYSARRAVGTGADVAGAIKSIQDAQAAIALGEGNVAPWQLLGIDPRQDPFEVLMKIHDRIQNLPVGVARHIAGQFGIGDDMFAFLRRADLKLEDLNAKWMITRQQENDLVALNRQWQEFEQHIEMTSLKVAHALQPAFSQLLPHIEKLLERGADWLAWLTSADPKAQALRQDMADIAKVVLVAAPAFTALAAAMKAVSLAIGAVNLALTPEFMAFLLAADAFYVGYNAIKHPPSLGARAGVAGANLVGGPLAGIVAANLVAARGNSTKTTTNHVTVNVNSADPKTAGQSVVDALSKVMSGALDQSGPGQ